MMFVRRLIAVLFLAATALPARAAGSPSIEVDNAWIRLGINGQPATAYFVILNHGEEDRLVDVTSPASPEISLGKLKWHGLDAKIEPVDSIKVPEVSRTTLTPGGYTAVLAHLTMSLKVGQHVPLTLRFEHGGAVDVDARVNNQLLGNR